MIAKLNSKKFFFSSTLVLGAIAATGIASAPAQAFVLTDGEFRTVCDPGNPLYNPDTCTVDDKLFNFVSASYDVRPGVTDPVSGETVVDEIDVELIGGSDYIFTYDFLPDFAEDNGDADNFTYVYEVFITDEALISDPNRSFRAVDLDATVDAFSPPDETLATRFLGDTDDVTLVSSNGSSAESEFALGSTSLTVTNQYNSNANGLPAEISSYENSFRQHSGKIPEPSTILGLLAFGGLGLGLKRKKQSKQLPM